MVVVALGAPSVPVTCCACTAIAVVRPPIHNAPQTDFSNMTTPLVDLAASPSAPDWSWSLPTATPRHSRTVVVTKTRVGDFAALDVLSWRPTDAGQAYQ